ncbi:MAG: DUF465 domain-containing protein [Nitrospinota bacterium]|nr:DUF465 domain-containing protein [Nitrospinota bacterium]
MEKADQKAVEIALKESEEFRKLYEEHHDLEKKLGKLGKSHHLPGADEMEKKKLQKLKLAGKDRMLEILKDFAGK